MNGPFRQPRVPAMLTKLTDRSGFTYLIALMVIVVSGIMLGAVGQSWRSILQCEREEELIFRGMQYRNAMERWYKPGAGQHQATPLKDLKDLVQDPRSLTTKRYLRKLYPDPITGKEWAVINDPATGISGVASSSSDRPLKVGNFPDEIKEFAGKEKYSDWIFTYKKSSTPLGNKT